MRFLFAGFGSRGDVQPLVALGLALQVRGHDVTLATPPDFTDWIRGLGLTAVPVGQRMDEFLRRSTEGLKGIRFVSQAMPRLIADQYGVLEPLARVADVMLGTSLTAAGTSFAEKFGLRYHYVAFSPAVLPSSSHPGLFTKTQTLPAWLNRLSWWTYRLQNDLGLKSVINAERRKLGLAPIADVWSHLLHREVIIASDPSLAPLPLDAPPGVAHPGTWFLPEREPLPPELEAFLSEGPEPLFVGLGSMPVRHTRWILDAVRLAGVRAISTLGGEADAQTFLAGATPHGLLFPRCAAVLHHGGSGTTAFATRAGVPQLVLPKMTDQFFWRARLLERGLVPAAVKDGDVEGLAAAIRACVSDAGLRDRALAAASTLTLDGVARTIALLGA